jgi:hypothetical protein
MSLPSDPSGSKTIPQLAVFIENRAGRLAEVCQVVAEGGNNIVGFSIADEEGFGIFRLIVDDADRVQKRLRDAGFTVRSRPVISAEVPHRPGGLTEALEAFRKADLNVEYMYAIAESLIVFSLDDLDAGIRALEDAGIRFRHPGQPTQSP